MAYWSRDFMEDWIPVEVRLPKPGERVLVAGYNPQNFMNTYVSIAQFRGDRRWSGHKRVSHWMPLPNVPEGSERNDENMKLVRRNHGG